MEIRSRTSPSASQTLLLEIPALIPVLGLGLAGLAIGDRISAALPAQRGVYFPAIYLAIFLGMIILDSEPGWNYALLFGFGVFSGLMVDFSGARGFVLALSINLCLLILLLFAPGLRRLIPAEPDNRILCVISFIYLAGWVYLSIQPVPGIILTAWMAGGVLIFLFSAFQISLDFPRRGREKTAAVVIRLFGASVNLAWLLDFLFNLLP